MKNKNVLEINPQNMIRSAEIGALVLSEVMRILEEENIGAQFSVACLASAVAGCLKSTRTSIDAFIGGVEVHDIFWEESSDNLIVFVPPTEKEVNSIIETVSDVGDTETN